MASAAAAASAKTFCLGESPGSASAGSDHTSREAGCGDCGGSRWSSLTRLSGRNGRPVGRSTRSS
eukprot:scaffold199875_cov32-Tisochrysis_lutea.AAC.1